MKLKTAHVTNFRSVEDSGKLELANVACLVGKNEAGKTAILQAITGLNPDPSTPFAYDKERDYPRRFLTEYASRHKDKEAIVIKTTWEMEDNEQELIVAEFGGAALKSKTIIISRRYGATEPEWQFDLAIKYAFNHIMDDENLSAEERQPLEAAETTEVLIKLLSELKERTEKQERLLKKLQAYGSVTAKVKSFFSLPRFMYFSHWDRMSGQVQIEKLRQERDQGILNQSDRSGDKVFHDFLEYAGTSLDEIQQVTTYESLNARCEAASTRITQQVFEYWTQNSALEIEVRVTKAESNDPPPFNSGTIARARVRNNLHKVTVPFSERSAGFIWFFSFLVKFALVQKRAGSVILMLDEPGLTLHGKAQADLLRYFDEKLAPNHQVIYSTHSPFMVPADKLASVKIIEDTVIQARPGVYVSKGTKVRDDILLTDPDSIFPLQGALGYEITQTLFVGKHTLLVEGPSDILYLQSLSAALKRQNRTGLDTRWVICPSGGIDKIHAFVSLFSGKGLDIAALTDQGLGDKSKIERLRKAQILKAGRVLSIAEQLGKAEADIEDIFEPSLYAFIINNAFSLPKDKALTAISLMSADENTTRSVKKAEAAFRVMPKEMPGFDHFTPASYLIEHPSILDQKDDEVVKTLSRAEALFAVLNGLLADEEDDASEETTFRAVVVNQ